MGYSTDFFGHFDVTPALNSAQVDYLKAFNDSRRMGRDPVAAATLPDPVREAVGLPIGPQGAYFVGGQGDFGQDSDASVINYNCEPQGQPGLWCQWRPSADGSHIEWDGGEKFYEYEEWLQYIITHFLTPWGCVLNGCVEWAGEEEEDTGALAVVDNTVRIYTDRLEYEAEIQKKNLKEHTDPISNTKSSTYAPLKI